MLKLDCFIPPDLAIAPAYDFDKLPNLVLREVPLDCNSSFQVWSPRANATLVSEEASLLKRDRLRLAVICTKLIWLLGATCSEEEDYLLSTQQHFDDWDEVVDFASKYGFCPDVIDVIFSPQTIRPLYDSLANQLRHWVIEPPCWEIFFLELKPDGNGCKAEPRSQRLSVLIWTGQPIVKSLAGDSVVKQI